MANYHDTVPFTPFTRQLTPAPGPIPSGESQRDTPEYDYIVVGAGSAGVCSRTDCRSDPSVKVLVLEEPGISHDPCERRESLPVVHAARLGHRLGLPQRAAARVERPLHLRAARQAHRRHEPALYDDAHPRPHVGLRQLGVQRLPPGWSYQDVLPYFRKLEDQDDDTSDVAGTAAR